MEEKGEIEKYSTLVQKLINNFIYTRALSILVDQSEYDNLCRVLIQVFETADKTLLLIYSLVQGEFERNFREPGSILRSNCVASKIIGTYSRIVGSEFLLQILGELLKDLISSEESFEIDPQKIVGENAEEIIEKNRKALLDKAQKVINCIISQRTTEIIPRPIRAIAGFISEYARIFAADRLIALVGGFIMLRLFNPCIVTPEAFGLLPEGVVLSRDARRNLTLISKLVQNLSNGVPFGNKEVYMLSMNTFLEENRGNMVKFLSEVSRDPLATSGLPPWKDIKNPETKKEINLHLLNAKDLAFLHRLFFLHKDKILEILHLEAQKPNSGVDAAESESFSQMISELGPPNDGTIIQKKDVQETIAFLANTEKSGFLSSPGRLFKPSKRHWLVLTENFVHYFLSSQDTRPRKSIPFDEINLELHPSPEKQLGDVFNLVYHHKDHFFSCSSQQELDDWVSTIKEVKNKRKERIQKRNEFRSKSYTPGQRLDYKLQLSNFEQDDQDSFVFVFEVDAFGAKWQIKKHLCRFFQLYEQLVKIFPRCIFPALPKFEEEVDSSTVADLYDHQSTAAKRMMERKSLRFPRSNSIVAPGPAPIVLPPASNASEASKKTYYIGTNENGDPSPGVYLCGRFWEAFFHEALSKFQLAQSTEMLTFFELNDPFRAVSENSLQYIQFLYHTRPECLNSQAHDLRTPLHVAVLKEHKQLVDYLSKYVKIDMQDNGGNTPLLLSLKGLNQDICKILLAAGSSINLPNKAQQTPLHIACEQGLKDVVLMLLEKGAKVDAQDSQQRTPLVRAIQKQFEDIALLLFEKGASTSWVGNDGYSLIILAAASGLPGVLNFLLDHGQTNLAQQTNREKYSALHLAAKGGHVKIIEVLMTWKKSHNQDLDCNVSDHEGMIPLMLAAVEGHAQAVELLAPLTNINAKAKNGLTALHLAAQKGHLQVIKVLEKFKAKMNIEDSDGRTPLHVIPKDLQNRAEVVQLLVTKGTNLNQRDRRGCTSLHVAVKNCDDVMVKALISAGAELNPQDEEGCTPLHLAIINKSEKCLQLLLNAGANVHYSNAIDGSKPLHLAASFGNETFVGMLLCCGADINSKNKDGNSPLHVAAEMGHLGVIILLVNAGSDINSQTNKKGNTPLHLAVIAKHETVAIALVELGANVVLNNKDGSTPLYFARSKFKGYLQDATKRKRENGIVSSLECSKLPCIFHRSETDLATTKISRINLLSLGDLRTTLLSRFEGAIFKISYLNEMGQMIPLSGDTPLSTIKIAKEIHLFP